MTMPVPAPCSGVGWKNSFWLKPWVRTFTTPGSTFDNTLCTSPVTSLLLLGPKPEMVRVVDRPPTAATRPPATMAPTRAPISAGHSHERPAGALGAAVGGYEYGGGGA